MFKHLYQCKQCGAAVALTSPKPSNPLSGTLHTHRGVMNADAMREDPFLQGVDISFRSGSKGNQCWGGLIYKGIDVSEAVQVVIQVPVHHPTISYGNLPGLAKQWVVAMLANGNQSCDVPDHLLPGQCQNNGPHNTDPRTGHPKGGNVGVREYYIGGAAGDRATARTGPPANQLELFWSTTHLANTYNYHLITNTP